MNYPSAFLCTTFAAICLLISGCALPEGSTGYPQKSTSSHTRSNDASPPVLSQQKVTSGKDKAQALFLECNDFANSKRYKEAIACLKNTIKLDSDFAEAYYNLGIALMAVGVNDEAAENLSVYLTRNPFDPKAPLIRKQIRQLEIKHATEMQRGGPKTPKTLMEISLVSFKNGVLQVEISNVVERNIYLTLCSFITLHTNQGNIKMTQGGTISGTFEIFDDPKDDCVKGKIKPQNKTLLQPDSTIRIFLRPKDNSYPQNIDFRSAFLTIPVCYQTEGANRGQLWNGQLQLGMK